MKERFLDSYMEKVLSEKQALEKGLDFKFETEFWELFSLSELLGPKRIKEEYEMVFQMKKDSLRCLVELSLVLNLKISQWFQKDDIIGLTYDELWKMTDAYALENLKGDDLHYYLSTLD